MNKIKINKPPIPTFCGAQKNFNQNARTSSFDYFKNHRTNKELAYSNITIVGISTCSLIF
jgi:hypothetical protein